MPIQILNPDIAAKIAAGEVVERPANVAKELIENSLDAGATEIRVEVREGGQRLLRIIDNGHGIPAEEAPLAFHRHATSKLSTVDDLNQIGTFGFRGEALYSIAAVSHLTLTSRARVDDFGTQLRLEGGHIVEQGKAGAPVGTVINVEHLFFNMPARKKFLRRPATEAGHIAAIIKRYALSYPECRFSFISEGRLSFQSNGRGDRYDVLAKIYGLENAKQMVKISDPKREIRDRNEARSSNENDGLEQEVDFMAGINESARSSQPSHVARVHTSASHTPVTVEGYVSLPSLTRANRNNIDLFVNRRYVEDRSLTYAVVQAYHTLLPVGRNPIAALFVELDPSLVDVNVHPQKTQVRFHEERRIFSAVQKHVRRAVIDNAPVPDVSLDRPSTTLPSNRREPEPTSDWFAPQPNVSSTFEPQPTLNIYVPPASSPSPITMPSGFEPPVTEEQQSALMPSPPDGKSVPQPSATGTSTLVAPETALPVVHQESPNGSSVGDRSPPPIVDEQARQLPPLRVVGQVGAMYIITEGPEGLYLIDQHAAHERILYEKFMAQRYGTIRAESGASSVFQHRENLLSGQPGLEGQVARQHLLEPLTLHIGSELTGLVAQHLTELEQVGFEIEPFGGDTFLVRAVPSVLSGEDPLRLLEEIVHSLAAQRNLVGEELEARLVKMVCKRAAIKAGQLLSDIEMQELVRQLETCQSPRTCPHGRPTMIQLSAGELEKAFGRT